MLLLLIFLRSSIGGVAYVTIFNSAATWAATFRLRGFKGMLVIFVFVHHPPNSDMDYRIFNVSTWVVRMRAYTHGDENVKLCFI